VTASGLPRRSSLNLGLVPVPFVFAGTWMNLGHPLRRHRLVVETTTCSVPLPPLSGRPCAWGIETFSHLDWQLTMRVAAKVAFSPVRDRLEKGELQAVSKRLTDRAVNNARRETG
jgi:hypothetical protein